LRLQAEGLTMKTGRLLDKGDVYKFLNLRTYIGEVEHKGQVYPGEHQMIVPRDLWDGAHAILQVRGSPNLLPPILWRQSQKIGSGSA
jgi:hypothetical protein